MKQNQEKSNKLFTLMKAAVREVIKEELSVIIKAVISESANTFRNTISESAVPPRPFKKSNVSQRVHYNDTTTTIDDKTAKLDESANKIRQGNFNLNDLKNIVSEDINADDPIGDVTSDQVDAFMNKVFG